MKVLSIRVIDSTGRVRDVVDEQLIEYVRSRREEVVRDFLESWHSWSQFSLPTAQERDDTIDRVVASIRQEGEITE